MRAMREYFGVDRATVTYEHEITGVGGNADELFVLCEAGRQQGKPAVRTTVYFTREEMAHFLADSRQHHPIEGQSWTHRVVGGAMIARSRAILCKGPGEGMGQSPLHAHLAKTIAYHPSLFAPPYLSW
jgi:hypothetical protein